jgi:poly-beta-1,6-N-acetyl-D-glucosamine synthase
MKSPALAIESALPEVREVSARKYVVVTPARNEAAFIELTLKSMVAQTIKPLKWVIVSDGSTDGTDEIVRRYSQEHGWIELLRMPERRERHFAGKVHAFNSGYANVKDLEHDFVVSMDADLSFDKDYFAFLLGKFEGKPGLGLAGTPFREGDQSYDYRFTSIEHVSGACQVFRRECFEAIGGYTPIKGGGIDLVAVLTARMKGWQTRTFPEKTCLHHRKQGSALDGAWKVWYNIGRKDYALGGHPGWEVFRWLYQMSRAPVVLGGCCLFAGYVWAMITRVERPVSPELMRFRRREQMERLKRFLGRAVRFSGKEPQAPVGAGEVARGEPASSPQRTLQATPAGKQANAYYQRG